MDKLIEDFIISPAKTGDAAAKESPSDSALAGAAALENLMQYTGQMVSIRNQIFNSYNLHGNTDAILSAEIQKIDEIIAVLQERVIEYRIQSAGNPAIENEEAKKESFVVFKSTDNTHKAAALAAITRLEEIDSEKIEYIDGFPVIKYRGKPMKIIHITGDGSLPETGTQDILVVARGDNIMGLAVDGIIDIAKCAMVNNTGDEIIGALGSIINNGIKCDVVDINHYFTNVFGQQEEEMSVSKAPKTVLLVDDSQFFRKFIPPELEQAGYNVITCSDAQEALTVLDSGEKVSFVVTDINMPKMDGHQFIKICKTNDRFKDIPFIALSSRADGEDHSDLNEFDAYVSKTHHGELVGLLARLSIHDDI